jgi:hypothetical protein
MKEPDRVINSSARSGFIRTECPISRYREVKQVKTCLTLMISADQRLLRARLS